MIHAAEGPPVPAQHSQRRKVYALYALLLAFNIAAWAWAYASFRHSPLLMGTSLLAWSFGLRHAVDADHIAAIDNVTRKLMQAGRRPLTVGLMFSLGHSTVVVLASIGIAATALSMQAHMSDFKEVGSLVGTAVSTFFLFTIALINLFNLKVAINAFRRVKRGQPYDEEDIDMLLASRGFLSRIFRPLFRIITRSRHMYLLGFLFGLGFDTATEVGLLGISAANATQGMPIWSILVFPALFTAGMTLIDTTDNILMLGIYGWVFVKPVRKLYYNITITTISVAIAVFVGGIEGLGLLGSALHATSPFWNTVGALNNNFGLLGYVIVGVLVLSWLASMAIYRLKRLDDLEIQSG